MNKKLLIVLLSFTFFSNIFAAESFNESAPQTETSKRIDFLFDYGFSAAQVTRIEILHDRSNFVRENYMVGTYGTARTVNLPVINYMAQLTLFYPIYNTFNGMPQDSKQVLLYAGDIFISPYYEFDYFRYVKFDVALGLHIMYQLTDEYHMHYVGGGLRLGVKVPLFRQWDIVSDFMITIDNANIGKNRIVQPFEVSYQYHVDVGFRFTGRIKNTNPCFRFGRNS